MTAYSRLSGLSPNGRRVIALMVALTVMLALAVFVGAAPAPAANCNPGQQKCFKAVFGDSATGGAVSIPLALTNESPAGTQSLGAVKITAQTAVTSVKRNGVALPACPNPIDGSPTCTTGVGTTTVFIYNLGLPAGASTAFDLGVNATCTTLTWAIEGRQSNKFQGSLNLFNLDAANSDLSSSVGGCATPASFSVAYVDQDASQSGTQGDTIDPVTAGYVTAYVIRVTNSGGTGGTATLTDTTSAGSIVQVDGCAGASGGTSTSCSVVLGPNSSADVTVQVQAPTSGSSLLNTASVTPGSSTASETTTIVPATTQCTDGTQSYDCVRTVVDSRRDLNVGTNVPSSGNRLGFSIFIKGDPTAPVTVYSAIFRETFDNDTCAPAQCAGNVTHGNVVEFGTLPNWCGTLATAAKCQIRLSLDVTLLPGLDLLFAQNNAVGYWEDDAGQNYRIFGCTDGTHGSDAKCEASRNITFTGLASGYITFVINGTAGDGRTGYCVGTVCV